MKKIAVICTLYGPNGGTGRVTTEIFERYAADGNEVHVFCADYDTEYAKTSAVTRIVPLPVTSVGVLKQLHFLAKATHAVKKSDYDIVYCTGDYYLHPDIITIHTLKKLGRKTSEHYEKAGILHDERSAPKQLARKVYMPLFFESGEQIVYRNRDTVFVGVSDGVTQDFLRAFGTRRHPKVFTIPNGVDTRKNQRNDSARIRVRASLGVADTTPVMLFVGSDWGQKRLEVALHVLARFPQMHLVVAGHDNPGSFQALGAALGCAQRVHFVGFQKHIEDYYSAADYFIFPSAYETFGLVALEAMAAGMIVVSNDLNGVNSFIRSGENGYITADMRAESFIRCFETIFENPQAEKPMREQAVKTAQSLTWENCYSQYKSLFDHYHRGDKS